MSDAQKVFDPVVFKQTTTDQWDGAAEAWNRLTLSLTCWLGPATESMFYMTNIRYGRRVLDVAANAGDETVAAARRSGPSGSVLPTDIFAASSSALKKPQLFPTARTSRPWLCTGRRLTKSRKNPLTRLFPEWS